MTSKIKKIVKTPKKPFDFILFITVILLLAFGVVMVLSASAPYADSIMGSSYYYVIRQAIFAGVGIVAMLIISKIDYKIYKKFYKIAYVLAILALISVAIPGIGSEAKGAKRWIELPIIGRFQPSEIAKILLILFYAGYLTDHKNELNTFLKGFVMPLVWLIPPVLILFFIQDHLSAIIVIGAIVCVMMIMAGTKMRYFLTIGMGGLACVVIAILILAQATGKGGFRMDRLTAFMNPWADPTKSGWQIIQSLYAIGSGGLFGVGLGESKQKYLYLSEPHNDFIFAIIAEELGFVGCLVVICLFGVFIWRGLLTSMKAENTFGSLLAVGITSLIGIQAIINMAVVTASMPVTGMSLPFISYGGTALLIVIGCVGILLNISRNGAKV